MSTTKILGRLALGSFLVTAGIAHLTFKRKEFKAQVPNWIPLDKDDTVVYSGYAEIALGTGLLMAPKKHRVTMGKITGLFFAAVFPGNIAQYVNKKNSFGLDTDEKRLARLFFQPFLIWWALESTKGDALKKDK
ncbi:DoxX family protein [Rhizosphaericola mali]|uniref:DoxX family membrane protein n=1 Tax=Rhizosphaericola mali TaxID=2545455 RepID=A0A5P2FZG0_9BACT|nr:hypothetical protein [Rhizosphaericola mali]QES88916.1 hypothetical protein E0W69_009680 [Rhizosphaericola mali]